MCACHKGRLWARIDLLSFCSHLRPDRSCVECSRSEGLSGVKCPCLLAGIPGWRRCGSVPHFADDMMDYPCHYRYSQRHSATDKTDALLHAGKAAIFLPVFRGPARAGVLLSGVGDITLGQTDPYFFGLGICHLSVWRKNVNISLKSSFRVNFAA